jgi:hypothetical protein
MATKRIYQAALITGLMVIAPTMSQAQTAADMQNTAAAQAAGAGGFVDRSTRDHSTIVGSWLETVTVAGGPTFKSLATFTNDGGFVSHDQGSVVTDPPFPHVFSGSHGVWSHQGGRAFTATFVQLISDLSGALLYVNTVQESVTLSKSRDAYRVAWKADFTDPDGNPIVSFEGTSDGRRIKAAPLP